MKKKILLSGLLMVGSLFSLESAFAADHVLENSWYKVRVKGTIPKGEAIDFDGVDTLTTGTLKMDSLASSAPTKEGKTPSGCYLNVRSNSNIYVAVFCAADHGADGIGWEYVSSYIVGNIGGTTTSPLGDDWGYLYYTNNGQPTWSSATTQDFPRDYIEQDSTLIFVPKAGATDGKGSKFISGKGLAYYQGPDSNQYGTTTNKLSGVSWVDIATLPAALTGCSDAWLNSTAMDYCYAP